MSKILHISRTMGQGGAEKIVFQLCEEFKDEFSEIYVASRGGHLVNALEKHAINHLTIDDIEKKTISVLLKNFLQLNKLIKKHDIGIVHIHHRMGLVYAQMLRLFNPKLKVIYTAHNIFKDNYFLYKLLLTKVICIAVGKGVKDSLPLKNKKHVIVIYNGVRKPEDEYIPTELKGFEGTKILCIARLSEQKGHKYLLDSVKQLKDELPENDFKVYFLGEDEHGHEHVLRELVAEYKISNKIEFLGYKKDVHNYINDCDFAVLPSLWEGFPLTPIEVFMNKRTIVATDIKGTDEIVNESNGMLVTPADAISLKEGMKKLLENLDLRNAKEEQAFISYTNNFSFERFVSQYREIYKDKE
ncbi:glycosyltransferase family 4 protein [Streptococcus merionis]|uniref:Exopolysaccharide biosynthesis protein, glycosyltransferase n=1 Tax=Streptococcus merionis TaxID=400065 RepID=A0A239SS90_9STRE|nr:glycosyltransferase family 4 protein [Streptococcus merionis]SNU88277.1 exopolysaccharide biosynthesis protein, glycosyltransferase [Streptococcus merionis]